MKISEYIAALTANGLTEYAARGLAKGQAVALSLVDDIGLTKPLASGLVKGLVAGGLTEEAATDAVRVSIAKGAAVDDLAAPVTEPVTVDDAVSQLVAASDALVKGKKAQIEMDLNGDEEDDDDDDDEGDDGDDDGMPDGLDGDDRGRPDTMPAKANGGGKYGKTMKGVVVDAQVMADALSQVSAKLDARFDALASELRGIAKGVGLQGQSMAMALQTHAETAKAMQALAKGMGEPRPARGSDNVAGVTVLPHPSETVAGAVRAVNRVAIRSQALAKGATLDAAAAAPYFDLASTIIDGADDATVQAAAAKLGLA